MDKEKILTGLNYELAKVRLGVEMGVISGDEAKKKYNSLNEKFYAMISGMQFFHLISHEDWKSLYNQAAEMVDEAENMNGFIE